MGRRSIYPICAMVLLAAAAVMPLWPAAADEAPMITEVRGRALVLYAAPTGKAVERRAVAKLGKPPLNIPIVGAERNGRYPIEIGGKAYWIGKAQVKETTAGKNKITAKCQTITKSFASSRGFGNCD